jgi:predicted SAM-dependent methyltransferase
LVCEPPSDTPQHAREVLSSYLDGRTARTATLGSGEWELFQLGKRLVPPSLRTTLRLVVTDILRWRERARSGRLPLPLRLHLGSGYEPKPGWTNVDLVGYGDLALNLARPLPFRSLSAEAIFHEHVLEHLTLRQGLSLLSECCRILRPGGVLRIGVPDTGAYIRSYLEGGKGIIQEVRPGRPTPLIAMQEIFYWYGHRFMYDFNTLALVCRAAGFQNEIERRLFADSHLSPAPDTETRRGETLYVETVK